MAQYWNIASWRTLLIAPIETCFEEAKGLLGMDEYEVRNWVSWHRHMTLVILAHTFLALTTALEKKNSKIRLNIINSSGASSFVDKHRGLANE